MFVLTLLRVSFYCKKSHSRAYCGVQSNGTRMRSTSKMLLRNLLVISSGYFLVHVQCNNYSAKTAACVTTDIVKMYQTHYIYLLHSSNGEGKFPT